MNRVALGLDYGTESARAVLVDVQTGALLAASSAPYPHGVIDRVLPVDGVELPPDWALQDPGDWLSTLISTVGDIMGSAGVSPEEVIGIGVDFTACTILPTTVDGLPLCRVPSVEHRPHAWPKLWKHHAAQSQARRMTQRAMERSETWLGRYGGKISSEWLVPKAWQFLEEDPELYTQAANIVEAADWLVWRLTGVLVRNACAAGYKGLWHKVEGEPSTGYLASLDPGLATLFHEKVAAPVVAPGTCVGGLRQEWATRLGLQPGTPVASPIIDAHAAVIGGGVTGPGPLFMIMGTSLCHLLMADREAPIAGIAGVVEDGIVPGFHGYEAGQAGAGDMLAWYLANGVPPAYHREAEQRNISLHDVLTERASLVRPGESGLLALDWWNGNRSTLVDAELGGLLVGMTLTTKPEEVYRALVEATAFGTRVIIESLIGAGLAVDSIVAGGGLTRNSFLMQIFADVTGREISVAASGHASALGAAILGAVAAGPTASGYQTIREAAATMAPPSEHIYRPRRENAHIYNALYGEYSRLYDYFGRGENPVMKALRRLRYDC